MRVHKALSYLSSVATHARQQIFCTCGFKLRITFAFYSLLCNKETSKQKSKQAIKQAQSLFASLMSSSAVECAYEPSLPAWLHIDTEDWPLVIVNIILDRMELELTTGEMYDALLALSQVAHVGKFGTDGHGRIPNVAPMNEDDAIVARRIAPHLKGLPCGPLTLVIHVCAGERAVLKDLRIRRPSTLLLAELVRDATHALRTCVAEHRVVAADSDLVRTSIQNVLIVANLPSALKERLYASFHEACESLATVDALDEYTTGS